MRNRTRLLSGLLAAAMLAPIAVAASAPSVPDLDAAARASGSRKDIAVRIGEHVFTTVWPVQVLQVMANQMGRHLIAGMRLSGVKFHEAVARGQFDAEIEDLIARTFATDKQIEEIDIWVTVPIAVPKGLVVSGDLAAPTTRTVFTISVRRDESPAEIATRLAAGTGMFVDQEWARTAFTKR